MGQTSSTATVAAVPNATYLGCYLDLQGLLQNQRLLAQASFIDAAMTPALCAAHMSSFQYFGLEYAKECWGADALTTGATLAPSPSDCAFECAGDADALCGAGYRINVYQNQQPTPNQCRGDVSITSTLTMATTVTLAANNTVPSIVTATVTAVPDPLTVTVTTTATASPSTITSVITTASLSTLTSLVTSTTTVTTTTAGVAPSVVTVTSTTSTCSLAARPTSQLLSNPSFETSSFPPWSYILNSTFSGSQVVNMSYYFDEPAYNGTYAA